MKARDPASERVYIVAESRLKEVPGAVPKEKKGKKGPEDKAAPKAGWQVGRAARKSQGRTYKDHMPRHKL